MGSQYIESGQVGQAWLRVRAHPLFPFQKSQMGKKNKVGAGEKRKESEGSPHFRLTQACARKFWSENFQSAQEVLWPQFSSALVREFALVTSDITSIEKVRAPFRETERASWQGAAAAEAVQMQRPRHRHRL